MIEGKKSGAAPVTKSDSDCHTGCGEYTSWWNPSAFWGYNNWQERYSTAMSKITEHPYVVSDSGGEPVVHETRVSVRAIVELWRVGVKPQDIPNHLPHITLAQTFDALSYYADHRAEVDHFIEINRVRDGDVHPSTRE